jgi:nucleotide-binding universal stress UspA family protein
MYSKILIAHDGSPGGEKALGVALALAKRLKAALEMVSVEELPRFADTLGELAEEKREQNHRFAGVIKRAAARAKEARVKLRAHVVAGHAVPGIVNFIKQGRHDLLVIGFMGHSALYNRLIGSTADRLVELAPCDVIVVK